MCSAMPCTWFRFFLVMGLCLAGSRGIFSLLSSRDMFQNHDMLDTKSLVELRLALDRCICFFGAPSNASHHCDAFAMHASINTWSASSLHYGMGHAILAASPGMPLRLREATCHRTHALGQVFKEYWVLCDNGMAFGMRRCVRNRRRQWKQRRPCTTRLHCAGGSRQRRLVQTSCIKPSHLHRRRSVSTHAFADSHT